MYNERSTYIMSALGLGNSLAAAEKEKYELRYIDHTIPVLIAQTP